jgi:putative transposase
MASMLNIIIAKAVREWITAVGARTAYIMPGSPWENGCCESFQLEGWRRHYNTVRLHFSLWPATHPGPASPTTPAVAPTPGMH